MPRRIERSFIAHFSPEARFIALLQHHVASSEILAALIGYRALYFLLPLIVACVVYLILERRGKKRP